MDSGKIWTTEEAVSNFVRVLQEARVAGPQEIHDATGVYELKVKLDRTKPDAAGFLSRRSAKS
ncbi:hypothetical protein ACU8M5_10490 [Rhizobium leguminosarum]